MAATGDPAVPPRGSEREGDSQRRYRLAGVALALLGVASAVAAALVDPGTEREILVGFAGVGLYGAALTYVLRPAATRDVDPGERVYDALAATGEALRADLDLPDRSVYAPTTDQRDGFAPVALVVRGDATGAITGRKPVLGDRVATADATDGGTDAPPIRPGATDSIAVYPTGAALFDAFEEIAVVDLGTDPVELTEQLAEAAVSGLGLAVAVEPSIDGADGRATLTVRDPRFGAATGFDHPVVSFLAVGLAVGLDTPVTTSVEPLDVDGTYRVVCEWTPREPTGATGSNGPD